MWLVNDPWIGTAHQPDVNLLCPVFIDGELFCWVANNAHQNDVGGTLPGSFCPNAEDIYFDPPCFPPMRIVKDDKIDPELEALYRRQSRTPDQPGARPAGQRRRQPRGARADRAARRASTARRRSRASCAASSTPASPSFKELLTTIPDGEWRERCYQEVAVIGDRGAYRIELHMRKEGDRLIVTNEGTDPEVGAINLPFAALRGTTLASVNVLAIPEQMGVIGGAARQISFEPVPGTITCPTTASRSARPGSSRPSSAMAMANAVITRMLLCSEDEAVRGKALATTPAQWHIHIHAGDEPARRLLRRARCSTR